MAFIKVQKLVRDNEGKIVSGSAAIIDGKYVKGKKYHSKHVVREKLGKVISLSDDKKSGIFLSPTRGLISYNASLDKISEVALETVELPPSLKIPEIPDHSVFGDVYLLLEFLKKIDFLNLLKRVFTSNSRYERVICHLLHGILKDGGHISCKDFIAKSFIVYLLKQTIISTLYSDTEYFTFMGSDVIKVKFFKAFIKHMRKTIPDFGKGCYVDSTPLPNDAVDNPFNALSCHGTDGMKNQMRLALILDQGTGLPIWYEIIPGNLHDMKTILPIIKDVENTLDIFINEFILDAGYATKELLHELKHGNLRSVICKMPNRRGYPYMSLYDEVKNEIPRVKYKFYRKNHTYFGIKKISKLFGEEYYTYVYVDKDNALKLSRKYAEKHPDKYEKLTEYEKEWYEVKFGYFILISTKNSSPAEILDEYFTRVDIEDFFKTGKEYLTLLPIRKWTNDTVRGKILSDIINTIVYLTIRKISNENEKSMSNLIGETQALLCVKKGDNILVYNNYKNTKEAFDALNLEIPDHLSLSDYRKEIFNL